MKITDEMVQAFQAATRGELSEQLVRAGLEAALRELFVVPDEVDEMFNRFGERYTRSPVDRHLWRMWDSVQAKGTTYPIDRTVWKINERFGPVRWNA